MEFVGLSTQSLNFLMMIILVFFVVLLWRLLYSCWISPTLAYLKLRRNGFGGPSPSFPLGNISEIMKSKTKINAPADLTHDIHSRVFPYFASWQKSHGKVFIYWLGTEPFLYVADPDFLKKLSGQVLGKGWGKPAVFRHDREPMFGNGLVMVEGDDWVRHRHVITPAFNATNLKAMSSLIVDSTTKMLDNWATMISSGNPEIDVEREITVIAGEVIAKTSFGISYESGRLVFEKLKALQTTLFKSNRFVGVPFSKFLCPNKTLEAKKLGKEIDNLFFSIIAARKESVKGHTQIDLLGLLLKGSELGASSGRSLTTRELVDECKTFFFGGHETTALAITWTMLLLAMYPEWQEELREEIRQVIGDKEVDATLLGGLKKMGWVMNEVIRLYPSAPNVQRQARGDIRVGDLTIPNGTNMWIDVVALHHDEALWGEDVNEFKPQRFQNDIYGGCKHKMGFLPFGFGGRMCVGRNLSFMEYKIFLTLILSRFSLRLSPYYCHSPAIMLSLRPTQGLPLLLQPL
ncbi:Cytochrome P450, E-class, group I [Parasponia andersonii]|uniref:Cytochrome P450, E-class, group I n=1 Tax=Parasponia andersonii TaxID=3476 RepID=A0A2P5BSH4_PARAD|nr:Cytochrome P450, E-class, group I [Parasponia andersonii]